jgi:SAM-dependent methyltransferase
LEKSFLEVDGLQDPNVGEGNGPGNQLADDMLWRQLKTVPAFRALLRSVEARFYQNIEIPEPVLDLGCGDGHFAQMISSKSLTTGIDPWWGPLRKAQKASVYELAVQSLGDRMPFADGYFASIISNSVLEHIPDIQPVLHEANRVVKPGGFFIFTTPSHYFTEYLGGAGMLERFKLNRMADSYRRFFNYISRHERTDSPDQWVQRLAQAGFSVERWQYYFSKEALRTLELGHVQGIPSVIMHFLTGHWIIAPWRSNLRLTERWVRPYYEEKPPETGTMILFIACKRSNEPIQAHLPPAMPIETTRLIPTANEAGHPNRAIGLDEEILSEASETQQLSDSTIDEQPQTTPSRSMSRYLSFGLILLSLVAAVFALSILRGQNDAAGGSPAAALPWLGLSLGSLLLFSHLARKRTTPNQRQMNWSEIPRRRWLVIISFLLVLVAGRLGSDFSTERSPLLSIILWVMAISLAIYGLWDGKHVSRASKGRSHLQRWEIVTVIILFLIALLIRYVNLTNHPFVLSGSEASIGLDAWRVATGQIRTPFGAAWLSNPTFPLFLMALPINLLGRTVLGVRFLSPLAGALAVVAIYFIGRRFWGPAVGLVAAILLAGSQVYVHFSRLGLHNIWDPLVTLLSVGMIYVAWQQHSRFLWLFTGLAVGLNAYFYTSAHLFPLILVGIILALLLDREEFWEQRYHLLTAGIIALIVSLPQLIFYRNNPSIFMERVNSLGIFQSDWLVQEVNRTGQSAATVLTDQLWRGIMAFFGGIDTSTAYNSGTALLPFWVAILFALGIGLALWRLRQLRYSLLLIWIGVTVVFAGALLVNPPSSHRLLYALPAVFLLIALAITWLVQQLFDALKFPRRLLLPAVATIAILLATVDMVFYFGSYQNEHRFADRNTEIAYEIANYLNTLEGQWTAFFHGPPNMYADFPTFPYLIREWQGDLRMVDVGEEGTLSPETTSSNNVYIFLPERSLEIESIQAANPGGHLLKFSGQHADPLFFAFEAGS